MEDILYSQEVGWWGPCLREEAEVSGEGESGTPAEEGFCIHPGKGRRGIQLFPLIPLCNSHKDTIYLSVAIGGLSVALGQTRKRFICKFRSLDNEQLL